jgi:Uma2 family endonuclease
MTAIISGPHVVVSDDDLRRIAEANPGWGFERGDDGVLFVRLTSTPNGAKRGEAFAQLRAYAKHAGGKAYDAVTGFKTPRGGVVSPSASWVNADAVASHRDDDSFWHVMPDVVIEVAGKMDAWETLARKVDKHFADGARYALAIDPQTRDVYERGSCPADLTIDVAAIIDA